MIVFRRRLIYWLLKEYFKKWRKAIFFFFLIGLIFFFILNVTLPYIISKIPVGSKESIGIVGAHTIDNLPDPVLQKVSSGLTSISEDGSVRPNLAESWKIKDNGKTYIFNLRKNAFFSDGTEVSSDQISYNFSDTTIERPDKKTIIFKLKESYSPFLVTVSQPIFKGEFIGIGEYKIKDVKLNGNFVTSLVLASRKNPYDLKTYNFYPSYDALKSAFLLGEVSAITGLSNSLYKNVSFSSFPNTTINKKVNYKQLVTLFYNTTDPVISDDKIRNALSYTIPEEFPNGERNYSPFSPLSWAYTDEYNKKEDLEHAQLLLSASQQSSKSASLTLTIKTIRKYKNTASLIAKEWEKIGVKTKIEEVENVPSQFQIFLGDFLLPKDPDQYMLWHQNQESNITHYKNLRIDKLLEDGRKITELETRKQIYTDFQKYLLNDSPATFLYFPYEYEIRRK